jgi:hypothetical protein
MIRLLVSRALLLLLPIGVYAQAGRGGQSGASPKASAPIDLTGYWTSVITEDWHTRMLTAPKGDFGTGTRGAVALPGGRNVGDAGNPATLGNIPYNPTGGKAALEWDPAKDESEGTQCKAYGAPGIMRQPTHLHITWQDDNTLKLEADTGTQTRLFHFALPAASPSGEPPSWPGYSVASWRIQGGTPGYQLGGSLKVVTTNLKAGYYWKNGVPYTANARLTEYFRVHDLPESGPWIVLSSMVEDPQYLTQPYIVTYQFKKLPDGAKWKPTPCSAR